MKKPVDKSYYVTETVSDYCMSGDAYITQEELFRRCKSKQTGLSYTAFCADVEAEIARKRLYRDGENIFLDKVWRCNTSAAQRLATLLRLPPLPEPILPATLTSGDVTLTGEQREAVVMALGSRLSMILGGAGTGKSTLISAIAARYGSEERVICAPTGKAARNISDRTGLTARTVHSACGIAPEDDFEPPVQWRDTRMVIVDEASMLSLELLAHLLCRAGDNCRIVLLGDENQLLSVGPGNVIRDLQHLGVPYIELTANHRQEDNSSALYKNVTKFPDIQTGKQLSFDDSFRLMQAEGDLAARVVDEAAARYLNGESFQLLTPFNSATTFSVGELNPRIRDKVNPLTPDKLVMAYHGQTLRDGDRVMVTKNDREKVCNNGDIGTLRIKCVSKATRLRYNKEKRVQETVEVDVYSFCVILPDGRCPAWGSVEPREAMEYLTLAYAITVHKSQGSQYDTVLLPLSMQMQRMLSRNLLYTAISRATRTMLLIGSAQALDVAVAKPLPPRKSMLVSKVRLRLRDTAA